MPSFDVVSEIDTHELTNAVDQAMRELGQRFDFKGTDARFELEDTTVTLIAPADFQLKQMLEILKLRIAKRGIDVACLDVKDPEVNLARAKQLQNQSPRPAGASGGTGSSACTRARSTGAARRASSARRCAA